MKLRDKRDLKAKQAKERLEYWQSLSVAQQLAELDKRPGEQKRQRARLESKGQQEEVASTPKKKKQAKRKQSKKVKIS